MREPLTRVHPAMAIWLHTLSGPQTHPVREGSREARSMLYAHPASCVTRDPDFIGTYALPGPRYPVFGRTPTHFCQRREPDFVWKDMPQAKKQNHLIDIEQKKSIFRTYICYLKPASVSFAKDTRHQASSRIIILQALDNAVDSVKEALPKGSTCWLESLGFLTAFRRCLFRPMFYPTY